MAVVPSPRLLPGKWTSTSLFIWDVVVYEAVAGGCCGARNGPLISGLDGGDVAMLLIEVSLLEWFIKVLEDVRGTGCRGWG